MKRRFISLFLALLCVLGFSYGVKSEQLSTLSFPFVGRWQPSENPLLLDDYGLQDIQNLRKDGKHFKGVSGHTAINTSVPTTAYPYFINGFHFKKDQPAETHVVIYAADSTAPAGGRLYQNVTAIPNVGNFESAVVYTPTSFNDTWRFSNAPGGQMVAANGDETLIWGGTESDLISFVTSSADLQSSDLTNSNDYTHELNNASAAAGQTALISAVGVADSYTSLLLHGEGANNATTTVDSSLNTKTVTLSGGAKLSTTAKKFGVSSIFFDGTDDYASIDDNADFNLGYNSFTIEFFVYFDALLDGTHYGVTSQWGTTAGDRSFYIDRTAANKFTVYFYADSVLKSIEVASAAYAAGQWHHFAFVRSGNVFSLYINGTSVGTPVTDAGTMSNSAETLRIGMVGNATDGYYLMNGYIDEYRITKGIARYTANFTPPTVSFGNPTNYFLVGSPRPLNGVNFYISTVNTVASTLTMDTWDGTQWLLTAITDETSSGGVSLAANGRVTWADTTTVSKPRYIAGLSLYWYKFYLDVGQATLSYVTIRSPMQSVKNIWDGIEVPVIKCLKWDGTTYKDYTDEVGDDLSSSYADLSSLQTTHYVLLGFLDPQQGFDVKFVAGSENATTSTDMTVSYWDGSNWQSAVAMRDGTGTTSSPSAALAKGGVVSFSPVASGGEFKQAISEEFPLYYYKLSFAAALDADVKVSEIRGIPSPPALNTYKFSETFQNRLFLFNEKNGNKNAGVYSMANASHIFNGDDSGTLFFGGKTELTAATVIYNVFQNSAVDQMIVTKAHETYRLSGADPTTWVIQRMSSNIGCVAPLSMVSAEVTDAAAEVKRTVAIWQSANGIVMSDGATIIPISDDIKTYWDPNSPNFIPAAMQGKSVAWYDPKLQSYKILVASGTGAAWLNTELEYSLKNKEWTKIYRENASGANPIQCGFQVHDTNGLGYTYGGGKDGFLYRLENGNNWNSVANVAQYIQTKDLILDNQTPLFRKSTVKYIRSAYKQKTAATGNVTITHYGDRGSATATGVSGQTAPAVITSVPSTYYNTQSVNMGPFLYHSFKYSQTTNAADGMELTGLGVWFAPQDVIR